MEFVWRIAFSGLSFSFSRNHLNLWDGCGVPCLVHPIHYYSKGGQMAVGLNYKTRSMKWESTSGVNEHHLINSYPVLTSSNSLERAVYANTR